MKNTYIIDTKDLINIGKVETINKEKNIKKYQIIFIKQVI
jgi:hypothetical protein